MIKPGKALIIGDEIFAAIGLAAGVEAYTFDGNCAKLAEWLDQNVERYDVVICLSTVTEACRDVAKRLSPLVQEKLVLVLDHPLRGLRVDPKEYYKQIARQILGVSIEL